MREEKPKVFVSYSNEDQESAEKLINRLLLCDILPLSERGFLTSNTDSENLPDKVQRAITEADAVVVVVGAGHEPAQSQLMEWRVALEEKWREPRKKLIPVLLDDADVPPFLSQYEAIRVNPGMEEAAADDLAGVLYSEGSQAMSKEPEENIRQWKERLGYIRELAETLLKSEK